MIEVFCDGLCEPYNPNGTATYGFVIYENGKKIHENCNVIGSGKGMTNNIAEYTGAIKSLEWLKDKELTKDIVIKSDSQLLIRQLNGQYAVRSSNLQPLFAKVKKLLKSFKKVKFVWIPREQNEEADSLSRKAYNQFMQTSRLQKAKNISLEKIKKIDYNRYSIQGTKEYIVDLTKDTCTCPDFKKHQRVNVECKHILAVKLNKSLLDH